MLNVVLEQLSRMLEALDPDAVPLCEAPDLWKDFDRAERVFVWNTRPKNLEYYTEKWNEFLAA